MIGWRVGRALATSVLALALVLAGVQPARATGRTYRLDTIRTASATAGVAAGPVAVGGATVRHAIAFDGTDRVTATASWRLDGRCSALDTGLAWPAPAPGGASARVTVSADGRVVGTATVSEPRPARLRAALGGATRIRVTVRFPGTSGFGRRLVALLEPRLTCSTDPRGS